MSDNDTHPLFDDKEENGDDSSEDLDSIPSPVDDRSSDPSFSRSFKGSLAVTSRNTRGEGLRSQNTSPVQLQHPIRRVNTSTALTQAGVDTDSAATAAPSSAGSQTAGDSKHSQSDSKSEKAFKMDKELKEALLDIAKSFKVVGRSAKQNSVNFVGDLPYFGVPVETDPKKNIIPISSPNRFLDIIHAVCDAEEFTEAGKISVMKSRLLGPAVEHWNGFAGGESWDEARKYLLLLYPEVESYTTVRAKTQSLKREPKEQIGAYAGRMRQLYDTLRRLHPSKKYDPEIQQQDMILKILEVLPISERKFIKIDDPDANNFF